MKILVLIMLLVSCSSTDKKDAAKKNTEKIRPDRHKYAVNSRQDRILNCLDRYLDKIESKSAYGICSDLFKRGK